MQVASQLPEHLFLTVLSHAPLPYCLLHLPPTFHPPALRAHHPSIDAHHSLPLHRLPMPAVQPALTTAATLTGLHTLTLSSLILPQHPTPSIAALSSLRALTALHLHNTDVCERAAAALAAAIPCLPLLAALTLRHTNLSEAATAALAAALPSVPLLAALDLSDNVITAAAMRILEPALTQCAALRHLRLQNTVPPIAHPTAPFAAPPPGADISEDCLPLTCGALDRIFSLAISTREYVPNCYPGHHSDFIVSQLGLLQHTSCLPDLRELTLEVAGGGSIPEAYGFANALRQFEQLRRLRYEMPALAIPGATAQHRTDAQHAVTNELWAAVAPLTGLTALDLTCSRADVFNDSGSWRPRLASIGAMTQLRHLSLRNLCYPPDDAARVACMVTHLQHLSSLSLRCPHTYEATCDDAVVAACALPRLRRLHAPISTQYSTDACRDALLAATQLTALTADMHVMQTHPDRPDAVAPWSPLAAAATSLRIDSSRTDTFLAPLVPIVAAHRTLRTLCVRALQNPYENALWDLLAAAARLPSLDTLEVYVAWQHRAAVAAGAALPSCMNVLRPLLSPGLTSLRMRGLVMLMPGAAEHARELVRGAAALTGLRQLACETVPEAYATCMPALPQRGVHALAIVVVTPGDVPLLRELLGHLRHLRKMHIDTVGSLEDEGPIENDNLRTEVEMLVKEITPAVVLSISHPIVWGIADPQHP